MPQARIVFAGGQEVIVADRTAESIAAEMERHAAWAVIPGVDHQWPALLCRDIGISGEPYVYSIIVNPAAVAFIADASSEP